MLNCTSTARGEFVTVSANPKTSRDILFNRSMSKSPRLDDYDSSVFLPPQQYYLTPNARTGFQPKILSPAGSSTKGGLSSRLAGNLQSKKRCSQNQIHEQIINKMK